MDLVISVRRLNIELINKEKERTSWHADFATPADNRLKLKESKKINKFLTLARNLKKKSVEHEVFRDTNYNWYAWKGPQKHGERNKEKGKYKV